MGIVVGRIINRPVDSNSFVIYKNGCSGCIVVDPGTSDCSELLTFLNHNHLKPDYLFLTHEHFDHIWGVNKLKELYSSKIVCSQVCAEKIVERKKNMSVFYDQIGFQSFPADIITESISNRFLWNNSEFEFIGSRGHTDGSVCIAIEDKLFTGDTIIKNYKTVIKFPGGSKEKLLGSLDLLFHKFNNREIIVYPGHGDSFYLNEINKEQLL
jgi:hydroxyacylglutathione hydrolase